VTASDRSVVQLDVESVDATAAGLAARGVEVTEPSDQPGWGIRVAHFRAPEGNLMERAEPLPDSD
jgi:predicted enzyme related to lactoylglutathione lyase